MSFPLYNNISKEVENEPKDLTIKQKTDFIKKIKQFDKEGYELMYALIRTYEMENNNGIVTFNLPYNSKQLKTGVKFELENLPIRLKHILYNFIQKHIIKMEEEKKLSKVRKQHK